MEDLQRPVRDRRVNYKPRELAEDILLSRCSHCGRTEDEVKSDPAFEYRDSCRSRSFMPPQPHVFSLRNPQRCWARESGGYQCMLRDGHRGRCEWSFEEARAELAAAAATAAAE